MAKNPSDFGIRKIRRILGDQKSVGFLVTKNPTDFWASIFKKFFFTYLIFISKIDIFLKASDLGRMIYVPKI